MTSSDDLLDLLRVAADVLTQAKAQHALIGGCARNVYAPPRATRDVDMAVRADEETSQAIECALKERGFWVGTAIQSDEADPVPDIILCRDEAGRRIDFLYSKTPIEEAIIDDARIIALSEDFDLRVASPEGLVALKLIAGRTRDLADVEEVLATRKMSSTPVDWARVEELCSGWDVETRLARYRPD